MNAEREAAEIIRPDQLTHYDSAHLKRVISELLRVIANERREHANALIKLSGQLNSVRADVDHALWPTGGFAEVEKK
mgnify:CR=1 FL=1|tara:strand:+ start:662 stop:892 length:231 start_codon:yes stop_codon:yes gene_type:complete